MIKNIVLLNKTFNYECVKINYNITTKNISTCLYHIDKNKAKIQRKNYRQNNKEYVLKAIQEWKKRNKNHIQQYSREYYLKNKNALLKKNQIWREKNEKYIQQYSHNYYQYNKEKIKTYHKEYRQTEKGKENHNRNQTKRNRKLDWVKLFKNPFDKNVKIEWHHINDVFVVAVPYELHHLYMGKYHREMTMEIVKQIYLLEN